MEPVILLHGSASSPAQWRELAALLSPRFRVLTPDLPGQGSLAAEADAVHALVQRAGGAAHIVGHSYGGAVALHYALRHGASALSLALIEPAAFHLLRENEALDSAAFAEIAALAARVRRAAIDGDREGGMARFIDYWSGQAAWAVLPAAKRAELAGRLDEVALDFQAAFEEATRLQDCWPLFMPTLLVQGSESPLPTRRICGQLSRVAPMAELVVVPGAGHLLPLTHAGRVNALLAAHLDTARREALLGIAA
jgi:pimeloyl-ACP methyl ester carboxylesterase